MLTTNSTTDIKIKEHEAYLEDIGRAIRMPEGKEKMQAIALLWMRHPKNGYENRQQMAAAAAYCQDMRDTRANKFGSSKDPNSGLRSSFSPPAGLIDCIESLYYDGVFTGKDGKKYWKVFKAAFPQFMASEVY